MRAVVADVPFIEADIIERTMDDHLRRASLLPTAHKPAVDVEVLLESFLKVKLDQHADLPTDVLGVTHFTPGKAPRVEINRDLTSSADSESSPSWVRGRLRSTMAHEGAHVILHRQDAESRAAQFSLFGDEDDELRQQGDVCLKRDFGVIRPQLNRREYQANVGMAAILMPKSIFVEVAESFMPNANLKCPRPQDLVFSESVIAKLAQRFQVSKQAAGIRVKTLGLSTLANQTRMLDEVIDQLAERE
ncbi:MAG: ImmA/IrrE family metallo-endopeptidase [Armatimonadetes bacterium]|nr:ImmA/IrrE family metallo-endopeptidase [Armatimonadota bacterium]MDE2206240.1 ImmA/IrrE family metallo-endopeptidase [Armatimonadota bacterium]